MKSFTEIRDNMCNMINYSDWLKLNSVHEKKKCEEVISKKKLKFCLLTLSFQMLTSNMHMLEQKIKVRADEISTARVLRLVKNFW